MTPAEIVRAAAPLCELTGTAHRHGELRSLGDDATFDEVLELLERVVSAVRRAKPRPSTAPRKPAIQSTGSKYVVRWGDGAGATHSRICDTLAEAKSVVHELELGLVAQSSPDEGVES